MVQFASCLRRVLCKTRLIFPRIKGPIVSIKLGIDTGNRGYNILCNFGGTIMSGFEVWSPHPTTGHRKQNKSPV